MNRIMSDRRTMPKAIEACFSIAHIFYLFIYFNSEKQNMSPNPSLSILLSHNSPFLWINQSLNLSFERQAFCQSYRKHIMMYITVMQMQLKCNPNKYYRILFSGKFPEQCTHSDHVSGYLPYNTLHDWWHVTSYCRYLKRSAPFL